MIGCRCILVAIGEHQHLGVAVNGDESFHIPVALDEVHNRFHFALRVGIGTVVGFRAGVAAGTRIWGMMEEKTCNEVHWKGL